jgi:hypothetical protein
MEGKSKHAKHGFTHTHIEHHADGSSTIHHVHHMGPHMDAKGAAMNHDGMMDHMMDHLSEPNEGEGHDENHEALEEKLAPGLHSKMAAMGQGE